MSQKLTLSRVATNWSDKLPGAKTSSYWPQLYRRRAKKLTAGGAKKRRPHSPGTRENGRLVSLSNSSVVFVFIVRPAGLRPSFRQAPITQPITDLSGIICANESSIESSRLSQPGSPPHTHLSLSNCHPSTVGAVKLHRKLAQSSCCDLPITQPRPYINQIRRQLAVLKQTDCAVLLKVHWATQLTFMWVTARLVLLPWLT